jgi:hypothetical protein
MSDYNNNLHEAYLSVYKSDQELALDYLVSEGYAETSEEAMEIYEQLEDGVIEGILDEIRGCGGKVDPENGKYGNGDSSAMMLSPKKKAEMMARRAKMEAPSSGPGRSRHMARADRLDRVAKSMKEEAEDVDTYDLVLEYLLDKGFADTEDSALQIMSNMSEEWRENILDEEDEKLLAARKKSIMRLNAAKNIEDRQADSDYENAIDHSNPTKGKSGYMEVPTDYRARRRRASGR